MRIPRAARPLRHRHFRWLTVSMAAGLFSAGAWALAVVWQVLALGGGPGELSLVIALGTGGMFATILVGGALADRLPRRRILVGVELVRATTVGLVAALSLLGVLQLWHLAVVALVGGLASGLYAPVYSAVLPSMMPADELLAANGLEGLLRPVLTQAAGPAVAGLVVAAASPGAALGVAALTGALAGFAAMALPPLLPDRTGAGDGPESAAGAVAGVLRDVGAGLKYVACTRWLLVTLLFATVMCLLMVGPIEVLTPFLLRDDGHGPGAHALVLTAFGIGGAAGAVTVSSLPMPRRYLSTMLLLLGGGCLPLVAFGTAPLAVVVIAAFVFGVAFNGAMVIWGTLLQRRVPAAMLGRVSSLDWFLTVSLMPVSMALAGPIGELVGIGTVFLIAGTVPIVLAIVTIVVARLHHDEIENPLISEAADEPVTTVPA